MTSIANKLNEMDAGERTAALERCCGSAAWVAAMQQAAPYRDDDHVLSRAESAWNSLSRDDWLEAFAAHPRIGDVDSLRAKYSATKEWATGEQAGVESASDQIIERLATQNAAYEARFNHLFIVCATGKSADEMLGLLESRLHNSPEEELAIAAAEQLKITLLRLRKLAE
ncbi:MAG: 2-oxo-4-hydroxy-4-carboxy-5-ureidoimidazoline decarboxylase [Planctomycetota bacterium]